jgi:hypothetical protein
VGLNLVFRSKAKLSPEWGWGWVLTETPGSLEKSRMKTE